MIISTDKHVDQRLVRMKRIKRAAGTLLAAMAGIYVFCRSYQSIWPWLEWLRAFAEAGMVGGLADWFAVTALFRHPLGIPIPHTAVIPRGKDRIGQALASFVRGNFLTSDRICKQVRDLRLVQHMAHWISSPKQAEKIARQTVGTIPTILNTLENNQSHHFITARIIEQLRTIKPNQVSHKLLGWLLAENRYRQLLAPLLAQLATALAANKERIEQAAGSKAPLAKLPLLGKISKAIAESISERAAGSIGEKLITASQDPTAPLWDMIHEQIVAVQNELATNPKLIKQLDDIRDSLLEPDHSGSTSNTLTERLWHLLRQKLEQDLKRDKPVSIGHLASTIMALGKSIDQDSQLTANIESLLLDGIGRILDQHGEHLEIMIRDTVQDWDPHTLIEKLERQVGPDLQFIRINGTLIGGFVGLSLHAIGKILW